MSKSTMIEDNKTRATQVTTVMDIRNQIESAFNGESHCLDIDKILAQLDELEFELTALNSGASEGAELRDDLVARVEHMTRAILVTDPKRIDLEDGNECHAMSASELIGRYRRMCAIFRDTFGGSLRYLPKAVTKSTINEYSDYRSS